MEAREFARWLRRNRKAAGLSAGAVCRLLGHTTNGGDGCIANIERGDPTIKVGPRRRLAIATALQVELPPELAR